VTVEEIAAVVRGHGQAGRAVRPVGGGTKLSWAGAGPEGPAVDLETGGLDRMLEHNVGDFTAVMEAGVRLADAQAAFAAEGQMLALDPPLGASASAGEAGRGDEGAARGSATVGGVIATADSGPLRHRYGGVRDLVVGITVVLSDGTIAKAGGKVIKNVAGYDLGKLFAGSYGTLGLIARVAVRLHPLAPATATVTAQSADPDALGAAALRLAALPLEADCFDVAWKDGRGGIALRFAGSAAAQQAEAAAAATGLDSAAVDTDDDAHWAALRALQRSRDGIVVKVSGRPTDLPAVLRTAAEQGATAVSRAALGLTWLGLPAGGDVAAVRDALAPRPCVVLDGADRVQDPWPAADPGVLAVMARLKERFDPARIFRPGAFVGGI
jgi:glycolate oxidase FAD binding subunit